MSERYIKEDCSFCEPQPWEHFADYGVDPNLPHQAIMETENLWVKPDVLPNAPFHAIIMPKFHGVYASVQVPELAQEYGEIRYALERKAGPLFIAEHGDTGESTGASTLSVRHQHTHLYGGLGNTDMIRYFEDMLSGKLDGVAYDHQRIHTPNEAHNLNIPAEGREVPYFYIEQGKQGVWLPDPNDELKSQTTQRSMHRLISGVELSWKDIFDGDEELAKLSVARVVDMLESCKI